MQHESAQFDELKEILLETASELWAVSERSDGLPDEARLRGRDRESGLILPRKRSSELRISEQESRVLLCRQLDRSTFHYSIETPTEQTYCQRGRRAMSGRSDLSIYYGKRKFLNVEFKFGLPGLEDFRKDVEKLLREPAHGLWFHTLAICAHATLDALCSRFSEAFARESMHLSSSQGHLLFCILSLDPALMFWTDFELDMSGDKAAAIEKRFALGGLLNERTAWEVLRRDRTTLGTSNPLGLKPQTGISGTRKMALVHIPSIDASTFLHYSVAGTGYNLRRYRIGAHPETFKVPGAGTSLELEMNYPASEVVEMTKQDRVSIRNAEYWNRRIEALNQARGLGVDLRAALT